MFFCNLMVYHNFGPLLQLKPLSIDAVAIGGIPIPISIFVKMKQSKVVSLSPSACDQTVQKLNHWTQYQYAN